MVSADMGDVDFCNPDDLEGDRFKCTADSSNALGPRLFGTLALQLDYATPQFPFNGEQRPCEGYLPIPLRFRTRVPGEPSA